MFKSNFFLRNTALGRSVHTLPVIKLPENNSENIAYLCLRLCLGTGSYMRTRLYILFVYSSLQLGFSRSWREKKNGQEEPRKIGQVCWPRRV